MPNNIKLTYFNLRGRAEPARLILAQAGVDYEDNRITFEEWGALKPNTPCGQLPILSFGGFEIAQSMTIARFLAREFKLSGKTFLDEAKADMIVDLVTDLLNSVVEAMLKEKDEARKAMLMEKNKTEIIPKGLEMLEKLLLDNGGQFFAGNSLTWADLVVADFLQGWVKDVPVPYNLKNHLNRIMDMPNIKKWVEMRPKSNI